MPQKPIDLRAAALLSVTEAAALKGVNVSTIRHAIARGSLPAVKKGAVWLLRRVDVENWVVDNRGRHRKKKDGGEPD